MIMCMSDIICVTNRKLCRENVLERITKIAACHPAAILLREKDLTPAEYKVLAEQVMEICREQDVKCILHSFVDVALSLRADAVHLPLTLLRTMAPEDKVRFSVIGASCHSPEESREAQQLGCSYITAGHVFDTDCKKGLPGRGISFLQDVCAAVTIPVFAIGGIDSGNIAEVRSAGASGVCLMSSLMMSNDVSRLLQTMEGSK